MDLYIYLYIDRDIYILHLCFLESLLLLALSDTGDDNELHLYVFTNLF